ncbi:MAG: hypothetical protein OHK0046_00200 [Anaerolineae bacterium]
MPFARMWRRTAVRCKTSTTASITGGRLPDGLKLTIGQRDRLVLTVMNWACLSMMPTIIMRSFFNSSGAGYTLVIEPHKSATATLTGTPNL